MYRVVIITMIKHACYGPLNFFRTGKIQPEKFSIEFVLDFSVAITKLHFVVN